MERAVIKNLGIGKLLSALNISGYPVVRMKRDNIEAIAATLNKNTDIFSSPCLDIYKSK